MYTKGDPLSDRYTGRHIHRGRHIRLARHGAWLTKKRSRSRPGQQALIPTAAALTVAGLLVGGSGAALQLGAPSRSGPVDPASMVDAEAFPPDQYAEADRYAQADRSSRDNARAAGPTAGGDVAPASALETVVSSGSCDASYYDGRQATASGEEIDGTDLTAAHRSLPFNTRVRVINVANGESVIVRINDRGPYYSGRCLNLSEAAFSTIADLGAGVVDVRYEVLAQDAT
jgi:rare lipoprotein A